MWVVYWGLNMKAIPAKCCLLAMLVLGLAAHAHADEADKVRAELEQLRQVLPSSGAFDGWLESFSYLPPDFNALPTVPYPQDLLTIKGNGDMHRVSASEWPVRRKQLAGLVEDWLLGHAPPAPGNVRAIIEDKKQEEGHETWTVRLEFGPEHSAKLHCWLWLPPHFEHNPTPVYLVDNFNYTRFARDAFDQGRFLICVYNATDPVYRPDKKDESENYKDLFGKFDWSEFRRRGWSASRAVDWLRTLDFVDEDQIYIGGHSRSAKQALAAAAFDERIAGVVASSPGSGGSLHFRYCDQYYYEESAERLTTAFPLWVLPKVRFFCGRENKLPADMHFVYALIAPRPVLMSTAINDDVESTWAVEQMYQSIAPVWQLLGHPNNLAVRYRPGQHHPDAATDSAHSRFLILCSEGKALSEAFPWQPYHPWNYEAWARQNPVPAPPPRRDKSPEETRRLLTWLLGDGPVYEPVKTVLGKGESDEVAKVLDRGDAPRLRCCFGELNGNFYYPTNRLPGSTPGDRVATGKLPAIVWLGPFHCSTGYTPDYRTGDIPYSRFARDGFLVLAFDPIATGSRQEERRDFYQKYPQWSLMGQMVLDARHAIDAVLANPDADPSRISLVGFGMGGMVATLTAALDDRVAATVSASGFTPFRSDNDSEGTGGLRRWSHLYAWLPRLGEFVGKEASVPVDFPEILSAIAPRQLLVIGPSLDWHNPQVRVAKAMAEARETYRLCNADSKIELYSPPCLAEFHNDIQSHIGRFLERP
jgi:dienelactone hydrolase